MPQKILALMLAICHMRKIFADDAPIRKWRRFGARGRFKPWLRRSSHVTVILEDRVMVSN